MSRTIGSKVESCLKSCFSNSINATHANLIKLHRKIKLNKKVHHIQDLGCHAQGKGHGQGLK